MRDVASAALVVTGLVVLTVATATGAGAGTAFDRVCSQATLQGSYGFQFQGTRPALPPGPPGSIEPFVAIAIRTYDGQGNFTQISNTKGPLSGTGLPDVVTAGTYQVNDDCTGSHSAQTPGGISTDRFVIVDKGREVRNVVIAPAPVLVSGVLLKVHSGRGAGDDDDDQVGDNQRGHRACSERTLRGSYGIQMQGSRASSPGGPIETVLGVAIRTYDGNGGFTQIDNLRGSITGIVPDRPGFGTYQVNDNCTAVVHLQPGPGILIEERLVIVDNGDQILSATMLPVPVLVTAVQKRISVK